MPLDYSNPHVLKFLTENFEKSEERCMLWFLKNQEKLLKLATFPENYKGLHTLEVRKIPIEICMPSLTLQHNTSKVNRRKKALPDGVIQTVTAPSRLKGEPGTVAVSEPTMKPMNPDVQSTLYKANGGRRQYLDRRKRELPEDKYNFCETSSNGYGWRLRDSELSRQPAKYGRRFTYKRSVCSHSGPQPDPAYYMKPPNEPYSKCFG